MADFATQAQQACAPETDPSSASGESKQQQGHASQLTLLDRIRGSLLGCAAGDAVGTAVEFSKPHRFQPVTDMTGGGPFKLLPGQWTDDTSTMLCLCHSLLAKQAFDPVHQLSEYYAWFQDGHFSSNGRCFDVGGTTNTALQGFHASGQPAPAQKSAGNGSLMRLCPVPLLLHLHPELAVRAAGESSRTTHASPLAVDCCRYFAGLIVGALQGCSKEELLGAHFTPSGLSSDYWTTHPLSKVVDEIACGSFKHNTPLRDDEVDEFFQLSKEEQTSSSRNRIRGSGYVVKSLEAALWAFHHTSSFEEGCLRVINLGEDTDTTAAIFGQLAGAYYGVNGVPDSWLDKLSLRGIIETFAAETQSVSTRIVADEEATASSLFRVSSTTLPTESSFSSVMQLYTRLEADWVRIYQGLLPGPKQYRTLASFDGQVSQALEAAEGVMTQSTTCRELLEEFRARYAAYRPALQKRLERPRLVLPGMRKS